MEDQNVLYGGNFEKWSEINSPSLGALIIERLQTGGAEKGFINGNTNEGWSRDQVFEKCLKIVKSLYAVGVRQNDMISIVAGNCHDYMAIAFGVFCLNAVLAPVNFTYTERELKHAFHLSKPKIIFVSKDAFKNVAAVCKNSPHVEKIIIIDGKVPTNPKIQSLDDFIEKYSKNDFNVFEYVKKEVNLKEQSAVIFLSSGTTGAPKGVEISQLNVMANFRSFLESKEGFLKIANPMKFLLIAPCSHVMGFFGLLNFLLDTEFSVVFLAKFELELYLRCIEKYKISVISVAPPILVLMAKTPLLPKFDLSSLKLIASGAAPLTKDVEDQVKARLKGGVVVIQGYGMSETTYGILGSYVPLKPGAAGKILKGDYVKVIDANGKSLPANKVGELCFKGVRIMKGYLHNPKATAETIKNGWLHTGDLGYYDDDEEFFIVDRLKELIKYKAYQVPPAELEGLLLSNSKIKDCGVIGIPDEMAGELPFAFVVKQENVELKENEVKDFVKKNASNAKWLRGGVKFINEIPKNPSGKILRRELRELFKSMKSKL